MEVFASVITSSSMDSDAVLFPEWVCVQSRGMKRWISIEFARKYGICANFSYFFPRDIIDRILLLSKAVAMDNSVQSSFIQNNSIKTCASNENSNLRKTDNIVSESDFHRDVILWKIMADLPTLIDRKEFYGIKNYIKNDITGIRLYQISEKIARIFDDYEIYRPEMILHWADTNNGHADYDVDDKHLNCHNTGEEKIIPGNLPDENYYYENIPHVNISHEYGIKDPVDMWQPILWKHIMDKAAFSHIADDAEFFFKQEPQAVFENKKIKFPKRISFFGISSIPPLFLKILDRAGTCIDINFFLLMPSKEFFGYINSAKQMGKIIDGTRNYEVNSLCVTYSDNNSAVDVELNNQSMSFTDQDNFYLEQGNPLLASMGTSIRNFSLMLEDSSCNEPFSDLWYDPLLYSHSMLARLQSDILFLVHRRKEQDKGGAEVLCSVNEKTTGQAHGTESAGLSESIESPGPVKISDQDRSISIHSCHGPMREAQILKDLILDLFLNDPDLRPHDIIVMMPDIESYAPYIESVFSVEHSIPFTISDRKKRSESEMIATFLDILAAADSRLTLTEVLDILSGKAVGTKFNFSEQEILSIRKTAENAGICWGMDSEHRKQMGFSDLNENTWWFGFQRLMLGYAMPENYDSLFVDILPCESFEGTETEILGKFAFFCDILFKNLKKLTNLRKIHQWCDTFIDIFFSMIAMDKNTEDDQEFIIKAIDELRSTAENACYMEEVGFEVAINALHAKLDLTQSSGAFLTGGMVFCNLMPMRSIPFKVVALMGMNDRAFPRQTIAESFNLIKKYPAFGDRIQRDEERYLFLEALLSARQNFIITYTGMSIKDNSVIPPAGVVSELVETMHDSFILSHENKFFPKDDFIIVHPLQPFNEKYFKNNDNSCIFSFSDHYMRIAENLNSLAKSGENTCKKDNLILDKSNIPVPAQDSTITLNDLISFFKMPGEYFIKKRLGIVFSEFPGFVDDREPVELDGLENYLIGQSIVEKEIQYSRKGRSVEINFNRNKERKSFIKSVCHESHIKEQNLNLKEIRPEERNIGQVTAEKTDFDGELKDLYPVFKASGRLPHGKKGKIEFDDIKSNAEPVYQYFMKEIDKGKLKTNMFFSCSAAGRSVATPDLSETIISNKLFDSVYADIRINDTNITGTIGNIIPGKGRYEYSYAKFSPKRILKAWIYHLVLNIIEKDKYPVETHLILRSGKPGLVEKILFTPLSDPFSILSDLIDLFRKGMTAPLFFFPETSWAFAESIFKSNIGLSEDSIKKAIFTCMKKWHDPFHGRGEKLNRYILLIFRDKDLSDYLFDHPFDEFSDICNTHDYADFNTMPDTEGYNFIGTAMKIFFPVIENMKRT